jgi:flagellin-like protein
MFEIFNEDEDRGQVGIGTLIVFIAMVLVAAIAAGVLINTAGFLQSQSEETGQQSSQQVTNRLDVVSKTGVKTDGSGESVVGIDDETTVSIDTTDSTPDKIGLVTLTVTKAPGAQDIDLQDVTIQWVSDGGTYNIVSQQATDEGQGNEDGTFVINPIKDEDGSASIVNSPDDRMELIMTLGDDGVSGPDLLEEGDSVTLQISTESSSDSTVRLTVPQSLSGQTAATL